MTTSPLPPPPPGEAARSADRGLVVGFDLDMTLVDSRQGIADQMRHALQLHGATATDEELWPLVGAPLDANLAHFLAPEQVPAAMAAYRATYIERAVPVTSALPGAHDIFATIRGLGGRVLVVSAKVEPAVRAVLEHVGLVADVVEGDRFAEAKGAALLEEGADVYIGDHAGDMRAARVAGAVGIGVLTGPHDEQVLRAAGADHVVPGLHEAAALLPRLAGELRSKCGSD